MTSAEAESGLVTEKNSFTNENTALTSHYYDPEICKLLQELSVDTKAARKSSEAHAKLYRNVLKIIVLILVVYCLIKVISWIAEEPHPRINYISDHIERSLRDISREIRAASDSINQIRC